MQRFLKYLFFMLLLVPAVAMGQKKKNRKPRKAKQENVQAPANNKAESESKLAKHRNHHLEIQDKATRKRMKRNERNRRRANKGRTLPFWKRWFRKRR